MGLVAGAACSNQFQLQLSAMRRSGMRCAGYPAAASPAVCPVSPRTPSWR